MALSQDVREISPDTDGQIQEGLTERRIDWKLKRRVTMASKVLNVELE